jgi:hypothetical protein
MARTTLVAVVAAFGLAVMHSAAATAAPRNDNYLSSLRIVNDDGSFPREFSDQVDTTTATTQADTFNPNKDGLPFGGGRPEPTSCPDGTVFGRTVWYDFVLPAPGGVEIMPSGFDSVVAVYEWDGETSQLGRLVVCHNESSGTTEDLLLQQELRRRRNYTIQLGGVGGAGGPLDFRFTYFPDTDGDGILDEQPDACLRLAGIPAFGGCPPLARGTPRLVYDRTGSGIRITGLFVDRSARGTRIRVSCRRCGSSVRLTIRRRRSVRVAGFVGRFLPVGDRLELRLTHARDRSGRYRFGAIGRRFRWRVAGDGLGRRTERCTAPGSRKRIRCP